MRITTRLGIISTATAIALIVLSAALSWTFLEFRSAKNDYTLADQIAVNFFERASFRDQYFLYREDRTRLQWDKNKEETDRLLDLAYSQFKNKDEKQTLARLHKHLDDSAVLFHRIVNNTEKLKTADTKKHFVYEELDKRLSNQLLLKTTAVQIAATDLRNASSQRVERSYQQLFVVTALFAVAVALITILISVHLGRLIRRRLIPLHDGARLVSNGDLGHRISAKGADEFTELAHDINTMTGRLQAFTKKLETEISAHQQTEIELRASEEKLQAILNAAQVAVAWADEDGRIEYVNPKFVSLFGYTLDDVPTVEHWYRRAYPDETYREKSVAEWNRRVASSLPEKTPIPQMEISVTGKDGSLHHTLLMGSWAGDKLLANFSDITERKMAELALQKESAKNQALLRNASDGIHILDFNGNVVEASDSFCAMLGYERNEVIGMNVAKWDAQFTDLERTEALTKQFDQQVRSVFETRHRRKDGTVFDVEVSGFPLELDGHKVVFNSSRDITERKKIEKALQESESRFRTMADIVPVLIWIADLDKLCTWFNKVWLEFTGRTLEQEYGNGWAEGVHPDDFQRCLNTYVTAFDARQEFTMEYRLRRHDGEYRWLVDHGVPRFDDHGKFLGYIGSCVDITDRHAVEDMAQYRAHHDPLTDLPNRSLFGDRLRQALASAKRDQTHLAILFIDLDKFKPVNDQFGHAVGDLLLQDATKRMLNCVRESDTVARIGGDEFVVLLPSVDEELDAVGVAEKIRHALNIPFALSGHELHISSSTGIAVYPEHGSNETQLFKHADRAMYYAKENGRNDVQLYHPAMG